ncbi:MAG: fibronectin type III domain-containing protein [Patescibacteria group bacterium]
MPEVQTTSNALNQTVSEPEITVIPDKFYGAALKARIPDAVPPAGQLEQPKKSHTLPIVLAVVVLLVGAGGVFVYLNRNLLFPAPQVQQPPAQIVTPEPPTPEPLPTAPGDLSATSTNPQSVSIAWTDTSANENGFRLERADDPGTFQGLTSLPPNSSSYVDSSVQPGKAYRYRIFALNQTGDSPASNETSATVPNLPPPAPEQPKLPPAGLDSDSDGTTDLEEALFGTDSHNPDTDGDGFLDGNEVYNLYNPAGKAPAKLEGSELVQTISGAIGWNMSVPKSWTVSDLSADGARATIVTGHGETFKLTIEDNPNNQKVLDWYMAHHEGVNPSMILKYRSKHGYEGIIGVDMLTTYIPWGNKIFSFTYDLDGQTFINYRTTYYMMLNSLVLSGLPVINVPAGSASLPFEPSATSTGQVNLPQAVFPEATSTNPATSTGQANP